MQHSELIRAVTYRRVSTVEQVENNSLALQQRECKEYAQRNGYEVVREFKDEGESAKTADRPGLQELLVFATAKKHRIEAVIFHKIDRLARNTDDFTAIRALLRKHKVKIISVTEPISDDAVGTFTQNILSAAAQFDNDIRSWRATNGMKEAVRDGRYVLRAPVGFADVRVGTKKTIAPDSMASLVLRAFELIGSGNYTQDEARSAVIKAGLVNKKNKPVSKQYFHTMVRNLLYTGVIKQFGEVNQGMFEAIVPTELFNRVQAILKRKGSKHPPHKRDNPDFPLSRFAEHSSGIKYTGSWVVGNGGKYPKYQPRGRGTTYDRDDFHDRFVALMDKYSFSYSDIQKLREYVREEFDKATREHAKELDGLKKRLGGILELETGMIRQHARGLIPDAVLKEQLEKLEAEKTELEVSIALKGTTMPKLDDALNLAEQFLLSPGAVWKESTPETRTKLQRFQFPAGVYFDGELFGTFDVSFIFNAKERFLSPLSSMVRRVGFEPT